MLITNALNKRSTPDGRVQSLQPQSIRIQKLIVKKRYLLASHFINLVLIKMHEGNWTASSLFLFLARETFTRVYVREASGLLVSFPNLHNIN